MNAERIKKTVLSKVNRAIQNAAPKISALIIDRITQEADNTLNSNKEEYIRHIQDPENIKITESSISIEPNSPLVKALEKGYDAFDIKSYALRNASGFTKGGYPFKDIRFSYRASEIPDDIKRNLQYQTTRERKAGVKDPTVRFGSHMGSTTFTRSLRFGEKQVDTSVTNKTGIFSHLQRQSTGKAATYSTLRRISKNSAPTSWWHPGFQGVHIFDKVQGQIKETAEEILKDSLKKQGLEVE